MKAVILAAGDDDLLEPLSETLPKAMLPIGRETVISRLLRQLRDCEVDHVCVVVGYGREQLEAHLRTVAERLGVRPEVVVNWDFDTTSTAFSTRLTEKFVLGTPLLLIDGDLVVTDEIVRRMVCATGTTVACEARAIMGPEEMKLSVRQQDGCEFVERLGKQLASDTTIGESIGFAYFDQKATAGLFAALNRLPMDTLCASYYEEAIDHLAARTGICVLRVEHSDWIEIDFVTDYLEAAARFGQDATPAPAISEQILLCPGPVRVSPNVRRSLLHADIGHRESEFVEILSRTRQKLLQVFGVGSVSSYTDVILSGSGTSANEAVVSSYLTGKRVLILANGEFGDRIAELCYCHGIEVTVRDFGWTNPYRLELVESDLTHRRYDALFMVHHETSTGMLNPLVEVAALCSEHGAALCVDAVSSLGAEELALEEADVALCTGCSNKALASLPGLSFVCGKTDSFLSVSDRSSRTVYLDLSRYFEFEERRFQTPNTPAVPLFFALESALDELLNETLPRRFARYDELAAIIRRGMGELGWETVLPSEWMSRTLTTFYYPTGVDPDDFHKWVRQHNYVIYRGKGPLLGRAFQVANMGWLHRDEVERFVDVVAAFDGSRRRAMAGRCA